jgi:cytochrome c-type biogenesis protein CcmE
VDLSPRPIDVDDAPVTPARRRSRRVLPFAVLGLVHVAGAVVVTQGLRNAIDYYCNVDEIGVREGCDPGRRLRVQGEVDEGSVTASQAGGTEFTISFNGSAPMRVVYQGDPGGIFQECMPVVVHGQLVGDTFEGDRIEVKHSNEYEEANPDRVDDDEAPLCSPSA